MKTWEKAEVFAIAYLKPLNKASCNKKFNIFRAPTSPDRFFNLINYVK